MIDLIDMKAFEYEGEGRGQRDARSEIPDELARAGRGVPREADGRGRGELRRADGALPRGRGDLARGDRHRAQAGRHRGPSVPGHLRRRDQEPRHQPPARGAGRGPAVAGDARARSRRSTPRATRSRSSPTRTATSSPTCSRPPPTRTPGRINLLRVYSGVLQLRLAGLQRRPAGTKERIGQLSAPRGKEIDDGRRARRRATSARSRSCARRAPATCSPPRTPAISLPAARPAGAGDGVRLRAEVQGRRGEGGDARSGASSEEDPTLDVHRDPQTGEQIIAGLTQVHVEVIVERMKRRFGAEIELKPPRVPYLETIRKPAKAHGRYKKQTGGRGQFGDCHIEIEPAESGRGLRVRERDQGRGDPRRGSSPRSRRGSRRRCSSGVLAGYPMKDVQGAPLRRPAPHGRLLRDGVQDRRLDGLQAGGGGRRPLPARADHADDDLGPRGRAWAT